MLLVVEQILNGLQFGLLLFLLAAGLTLVFGIMDLVNLAHGSLYMMGAYFAATFVAWTGSFLLGALLALGATLVLGIVRSEDSGDGARYFNSVLALGDKDLLWYNKSHLVPFAEFFPVPDFVRSWLRLRNLPYEDFTRGAPVQPPLPAAGLKLAVTICYEDAYGSSQLPVLRQADALVNVTNDAWFGDSTARHQHFQIARMRAMEAQRYLVRAANDGISGVIGPHGEVVARAPEFTPYVLRSAITARSGLPPYAHVGNWPVILLALAGVAAAVLRQRAKT